MAGDEPRDITRVKTTYSYKEAFEYLKRKNGQPTNLNERTRWFNARTGREVILGTSSV